MMRLILCALMTCGVVIAVQPAFQQARVVALWSDFKAFEGRVATLANGNAVLSLGGERDSESFGDLLRKLWALKDNPLQTVSGVVVFLLSVLGICLDVTREKRLNSRTRRETD